MSSSDGSLHGSDSSLRLRSCRGRMSWRLSTRQTCASKKGLRQKRRTSRGGSMEIRTFDQLLEEAKKRGRKKLAVAFPEEVSLHAALLAHEAGIAAPVLVGVPDKIRELLVQAGADPDAFEIEEADSPAEAVSYTHLTLPTNREVYI